MTYARLFLSTIAALSLLACGKGPIIDQGSSTNEKPREALEVRISDMAVNPAIAQITEGGHIYWINLSTTLRAAVIFPTETIDQLTCKDLRPLWTRAEAGVLSTPILGDADSLRLPPCTFPPGEYDYKATLFDPASIGDVYNPKLTINAKLVVKGASASD